MNAITDSIASLRAAAVAGIDRFISKAKREQRQELEIREWNKAVDERNAKKLAKRQARKARK